jgi:hypothetical protein
LSNKTEIISPNEGETIPWMTPIEGTYSDKYKDQDLWIVVQPVNWPKYYPQKSKIPKQSNHNWKDVVYIGESISKNIGDKFIIHLVSANKEASSIFSNYLNQSAICWNESGMVGLPSNSNVVLSRCVYRK